MENVCKIIFVQNNQCYSNIFRYTVKGLEASVDELFNTVIPEQLCFVVIDHCCH